MLGQKEANTWYFGKGSGLDFSTPVPSIIAGAQNVTEGSSVVSDSNGNLIFYTAGEYIYDKQHNVMKNGSGIKGHESTTQALIVKQPGNNSNYYVFTIEECAPTFTGLYYSIVDISQNGGLGEVIEKNKLMLKGVEEKVTASFHCNKKDIWILSFGDKLDHKKGERSVNAFLLYEGGVNTVPVVTKLHDSKYNSCGGWMKASPKGDKIVWDGNSVELGYFNQSTGKVDSVKTLNLFTGSAYGVEFSPNGEFVYARGYQYEIKTGSYYKYDSGFSTPIIGPDFKIYLLDHYKFLSVIEEPNQKGVACKFYKDTIVYNNLHQNSILGLPNFPPFYFDTTSTFSHSGDCPNSKTKFKLDTSAPVDSVVWIVEGKSHKEFDKDFEYVFNTSGSKDVIAKLFVNGKLKEEIIQCVEIKGQLSNFLTLDSLNCPDSVVIKPNYPFEGTYLWNTGSSENQLKVGKSGTYELEINNGCFVSTHSVNIDWELVCPEFKIVFPNVVTPNGDGVNDKFGPFKWKESSVDLNISIYDRWGRRVFKSNDPNFSWDASQENEGVYFYTLLIPSSNLTFSGFVYVK